uniref:BSMP protein n=1 Tax=Patella vulgata TaxID=6465 RepID=J7Q5J6_PATVU|nr:BSMP protein [Patella vulgata]
MSVNMKELILVVLVAAQYSITHARDGTCGQQRFDVIALVDGSGSIATTDFQKIKTSLEMFPALLGLNGVDRRFGVAVFSNTATVPIPLSSDVTALMSDIASLQQPNGGTNTALGLTRVIQEFENFGIPENKQFIIVITDGMSNNMAATLAAAAQAKDMGINVFAIGVGNGPDAAELEGIASNPSQVIIADNFDQLTIKFVDLIAMVCNDDGSCSGCIYRNGIGYLPTSDCDKFLQCQLSHPPIIRQCPFGTYWDQSILTCNHRDQVNCTNAPCLGRTDGYRLNVSGNCSQYYECEGEVQKLRACADGFSFDTTIRVCVADENCTDNCQLIENPSDVCVFGQMVHGQQITQNCPAGMGFNKTTCRCTIDSPGCGQVSVPCEPLVDIDFQTAEAGEYDNYGAFIDTDAGTAYFNGNTAIRILRLSNVEFRKNLTIKVAYRVDYSTPIRRTEEEAVVTNGDCGKPSTIEITRTGNDTNIGVVTFDDATSTSTSRKLVIDTQADWREVKFFFNKSQAKLLGEVNGISGETNVEGTIIRSQCAFQLGSGEGLANFRGWIKYIIVTECDH